MRFELHLALFLIHLARLSSPTPTPTPSSSPVIVLVYGELERGPRPATSSTIATQVVAPLVNRREDVAVVVSTQRFRSRLHLEKHRDRWGGLSSYGVAEVMAAEAGTRAAFLAAGASRVHYTLHDHHRHAEAAMETIAADATLPLPRDHHPIAAGATLPPSRYSLAGVHPLHYGFDVRYGFDLGDSPRTQTLKPHDAPSARAHLFARHTAFLDLMAAEAEWGVPDGHFQWVILCRNDGLWLGPIGAALPPAADSALSNRIDANTRRKLEGIDWNAVSVVVKDCVDWGGLNDKVAVVKRWTRRKKKGMSSSSSSSSWSYDDGVMASWFDTRRALGTYNYSSVETLLLAIASHELPTLDTGRDVPARRSSSSQSPTSSSLVRLSPSSFPFVDHYFFLNCTPAKYAHSSLSLRACAAPRAPPAIRCHKPLQQHGNQLQDSSMMARVSILEGKNGPAVCGSCDCLPSGLCRSVNDNICASHMTVGGFDRKPGPRTNKVNHIDCEEVYSWKKNGQRRDQVLARRESSEAARGG